jgi:hypothetical protein
MEWIDWEAKGLTEDDLRHLQGHDVLSADYFKALLSMDLGMS